METRLENVRAAARAQILHDPGFEPARLVQALCEALAAGHPAPGVAEAAGQDVVGMLQILRIPPGGSHETFPACRETGSKTPTPT